MFENASIILYWNIVSGGSNKFLHFFYWHWLFGNKVLTNHRHVWTLRKEFPASASHFSRENSPNPMVLRNCLHSRVWTLDLEGALSKFWSPNAIKSILFLTCISKKMKLGMKLRYYRVPKVVLVGRLVFVVQNLERERERGQLMAHFLLKWWMLVCLYIFSFLLSLLGFFFCTVHILRLILALLKFI